MNRTRLSRTLASLAIMACGLAALTSAHAARQANGLRINGTSFNGTSFNGTSFNGDARSTKYKVLNGIRLRGAQIKVQPTR
jgi:hypothetical protein